ncbi:DUF456 domain-containing protein [Desulfolucanica intricata]|uniref:DUF456 domain-containing protein n=1 Tax=Desulfolucanica intricata TaxID=1285191 RepID=UPI00083094E5|nr:DUF456 domain-containing protein [Desulfolucanica intricata]
MHTTGLIIASLLFILGLAGTTFPVLPGAILIWLGMLIYGFLEDFVHFTWTFYLFQGLAVIVVFLLDYAAGIWGVKYYGGSRSAIWGSILGAILGIILLGPLGIILGPFLGSIAGELLTCHSLNRAVRAGVGTLIGFLGGTILKLAIEIGMIVWFFMILL